MKERNAIPNESGTNRRKFLRNTATVGLGILGLGVSSGAAAADKPRVARRIKPDVSKFGTLDSVQVTILEDGGIILETTGEFDSTENPDFEWEIKVRDVRNEANEVTPERAIVKVKPGSGRPTDTQDGQVTGSGEAQTNDDSGGVGTLGHNGRDSETDYEGGMYIHSKDPANLSLCATDHWLDWGGSSGDMYWNARRYWWRVWDYKESTWHKEDAGFLGSVDVNYSSVETAAYGDYYNWNWQNDDQYTYAYHEDYVTGYANGNVGWNSLHSHSGEDSGMLYAVVGNHSTYEDGPGP